MPKHNHEEGIVYLVGAGPGDPDLITVRANYLLHHCDVVVYDSLIPYELVYTLPAEIERRYVGKESGRHSLPQEEINNLLVRLALDGKRVVRLKGGDPFVFGRGGEEAKYLKEHGIRYEVVPGITSGVAALAYAGIPCTDRENASYVMFLTGHKAIEKASSSAPWDWVAGAREGTLVIYMAVSEIKSIVDQLLDAGMSPNVAAAVVERGTFSTQRVVRTELAQLPGKVAEVGIKPPALFVIGEVATYREKIQWFRDRPLFGVRVMVTRPADQAAPLYRTLRELGAEVLAYPTIATAEDHRPDEWDALRKITTDDRWLVLTNENSVRYFLNQWFTEIGDLRGLNKYKIAVVGDGTARALAANHIAPDFVPSKTATSVLARELSERLRGTSATVVRVRGNLSDDQFEKTVGQAGKAGAAGAEVIPLQVYRTFHVKWPTEAREKLFAFPPDVILFTSGAAIDGLAENLDADALRRLAGDATVASIGPSTSKTIRSYGVNVDLESEEHTIASMVDELVAVHRITPLPKKR
ncbi:MAG: uroporphyrinogen-III C-methyltransferase [Candidatus Krumholzibacteria bacterium]|nr:uroporphyrinogen-III C-methyltransferase [Candidatus Krumholzibacteria bacterium]